MADKENLRDNAEKDRDRLNRRFDQIEEKAPSKIAQGLSKLRRPNMRWVRIPLGVLLVIGGVFSILPVLGLWMLPLGLLLLAIDLPFLRAPVNRAVLWIERKWKTWRRKT